MAPERDSAREMLVAAISGSLGGAMSKAVTYPLETMKTCLANKDSSETSLEVLQQLWGFAMYKGIKLRLSKSIFHNFVFFYVMEGITQLAKRLVDFVCRRRGLPTGEVGMGTFLLAGFCGDALNMPVLSPIDTVLSQVQTSKQGEGVMSVVRRIYDEQGVAGFYIGWQVYIMASLRPAVKFGLIETIKKMWLRGKSRDAVLSVAQAFWLGALTNALASTLFYPLNTARIVIMSRRRGAASTTEGRGSDNIVQVIRAIAQEEGVRGLYKGLASEISEGTLGSALFLAIKEQLTQGVQRVVYMSKT
eukprot:TRINITY_DN44007_c0_g1_i1.p1 TRINITY_DN44007_c0_g1~~TRINITY_DN44007_c0_g1_i1.p1  ORF type:complete len:304 (+),score=28.27 TRINITY_DN44007_c0_g1_i1:76-987(+)